MTSGKKCGKITVMNNFETQCKDNKIYRVIVIGGGAAGLFFAAKYGNDRVLLLEKNDRLGKKLAATGGGRGNITNENIGESRDGYFSVGSNDGNKIDKAIAAHTSKELRAFLLSIGCITTAEKGGRVYPASYQASSIGDCLRAEIERKKVCVKTGEIVQSIRKVEKGVEVQTQNGVYTGEKVLICTGGKAASHFGSDGSGYILAQSLGHTITPLSPVLVQLKCAEKGVRTLKGIRIYDAAISLFCLTDFIAKVRGDILFTDFGISGDGAFKISSYLAAFSGGAWELYQKKSKPKLHLLIDFLPQTPIEQLENVLMEKIGRYPKMPQSELLSGIVNNQVGRQIAAVVAEKYGDLSKCGAEKVAKGLAECVKGYPLTPIGSLGFDNAQATHGGIPLREVKEDFSSFFAPNVYFAGEILDVDGACGGYNLQWAYSSACVAGDAIFKESVKK